MENNVEDTELKQLTIISLTGHEKKKFLQFGKQKPENFLLKLELVEEPYSTIDMIVGRQEASELAIAIEGIDPGRPMPSQLLKSAIELFGYSLSKVVIEKLEKGIFYSTLYLIKDSEIKTLDSRPADAIAQAVRFDCPLYCTNQVLEKLAEPLPS
jgi:bifunctional DNase/RNase